MMLKNFWNLLRNKGKEVEVISGKRCYLKPFVPEDAKDVAQLVLENRDFWSLYEPRHVESYYSVFTQYHKLAESARLRERNLEHFYGIYEYSSEKLIGQISLYNIKPLPFSSCFIGYAMDQHYTGKGIASEAIELIVNFAFYTLQVNRIEAYVSPRNMASIRVLEKAGFKQEGLLKELLYINGKWEDHYIYALTANRFFKGGER